jgi:hypothetical protein
MTLEIHVTNFMKSDQKVKVSNWIFTPTCTEVVAASQSLFIFEWDKLGST